MFSCREQICRQFDEPLANQLTIEGDENANGKDGKDGGGGIQLYVIGVSRRCLRRIAVLP